MTARSFDVRNKRFVIGRFVKSRSEWNRKSRKKKREVYRGKKKVKEDYRNELPRTLQNRRQTTLGNSLRRVSHPEEAVHLNRYRARFISKELAQIHRVSRDSLPCAKITDLKNIACLKKKNRSCPTRRTDFRREQRRLEECVSSFFFFFRV